MATSKFHLLPTEPEPDPRARTRTVTLSGQKVEAITNLDDFGDEIEQPYHNVWRKGSSKEPDCTWALEIETPNGTRFHRMWERGKRKRSIIWRDLGAVVVENATGYGFAEIVVLRRWPFLLLPVLAALVLCLSLVFCAPAPDGGSLGFLDGAKSSGGTSQPVVSIDYASYDASVDSTWVADTVSQDVKLTLPATCTHGGETGRNPVASSPSLYVDMDGNGDFDESECVYNAPDSSGYGKLLSAGSEVDSIELDQAIPAGQYTAMTVWRSVLASDHSQPAGQSSFTWALTVE